VQEKVRVSDPQAVEQALAGLRQASLTGVGPALPPVRATALNLVGYAGEPPKADQMARQAAALADQYPSRTIVLGARPARQAGDWDIWVWAHCHRALPGQVICFEAIQIMADGQDLERVPAVVLSLLLRDLPVVLWWPGDVPVEAALFQRLMADSGRLIVDSASAADPQELLRHVAALGHAEQCECIISDLNWGRLTPWRQLTAQFFDPPDCRPCLESLEHVRLEFARPPGQADSVQAYLFVAWLATRLDWTPATTTWSETPAGKRMNLRRGQQPMTVELVPLPAQAGEQGLCSLTLRASHPEGQALFTIRRTATDSRAVVSTALPNREVRQRVVPFPAYSETDLLAKELERPGYDLAFQETLELAASFSG
jgi:glucose-6-phosphate dehydrogenase assembly protein OpcA